MTVLCCPSTWALRVINIYEVLWPNCQSGHSPIHRPTPAPSTLLNLLRPFVLLGFCLSDNLNLLRYSSTSNAYACHCEDKTNLPQFISADMQVCKYRCVCVCSGCGTQVLDRIRWQGEGGNVVFGFGYLINIKSCHSYATPHKQSFANNRFSRRFIETYSKPYFSTALHYFTFSPSIFT